jgi:hypothetical protein
MMSTTRLALVLALLPIACWFGVRLLSQWRAEPSLDAELREAYEEWLKGRRQALDEAYGPPDERKYPPARLAAYRELEERVDALYAQRRRGIREKRGLPADDPQPPPYPIPNAQQRGAGRELPLWPDKP